MFLSLLSGWMLWSPACSRTHPIYFCSWMCILATRNISVTVFFPLPSVSYFSVSKYGMHFSSIHYGESDESTNVTPAAVPELVECSASLLDGAHHIAAALLRSARQQHRHPPSSCCSVPCCRPRCHDSAEPSSGTATEWHSCLAVLPPSSQTRPRITVTVLAGLKKLQPLQARQELQDDCNATGLLTSPAMT